MANSIAIAFQLRLSDWNSISELASQLQVPGYQGSKLFISKKKPIPNTNIIDEKQGLSLKDVFSVSIHGILGHNCSPDLYRDVTYVPWMFCPQNFSCFSQTKKKKVQQSRKRRRELRKTSTKTKQKQNESETESDKESDDEEKKEKEEEESDGWNTEEEMHRTFPCNHNILEEKHKKRKTWLRKQKKLIRAAIQVTPFNCNSKLDKHGQEMKMKSKKCQTIQKACEHLFPHLFKHSEYFQEAQYCFPIFPRKWADMFEVYFEKCEDSFEWDGVTYTKDHIKWTWNLYATFLI